MKVTAEEVRQYFDRITQRYDFINQLVSFGQHMRLKRIIASMCPKNSVVLDLCTGTGDIASYLLRKGISKVVGVDFSFEMIRRARHKLKKKVSLVVADALYLPFKNDTFDACTIGFGVRNFVNIEKGIKEIRNVLKQQGQMLILETCPPTGILHLPYAFFLRYLLPIIGWILTRTTAYTYLAYSVMNFLSPYQMQRLLKTLGFKQSKSLVFYLGIVAIYYSQK